MKIRIYSFLFFFVVLTFILTILPPHFKGSVSEPGARQEEEPLLTAEVQANANMEVVVDCTPLNFSEEYVQNSSPMSVENVSTPQVATPSATPQKPSKELYLDAPGGYPESHLFDHSGHQKPTFENDTEENPTSKTISVIEDFSPESFLNESPMVDKSLKNTFQNVSRVAGLDLIPREPGVNGRSIYGLREHYIEDGDTLPQIAARYLRDENRYMEIYELNQNVLTDPEILPLNCVLQIPDLY